MVELPFDPAVTGGEIFGTKASLSLAAMFRFGTVHIVKIALLTVPLKLCCLRNFAFISNNLAAP
jgi:hypothetical protein